MLISQIKSKISTDSTEKGESRKTPPSLYSKFSTLVHELINLIFEHDFLSISNLIFTACVACKNQVRNNAELLQLKPHPFICMRNFINKKLEIEKTKPTFSISVLKVEY